MEGSRSMGKKYLTRENLIYLLFISTYLHFAITAVVFLGVGVFILCNKFNRKQVFVHPGSKFIPVFSAAALLMALIAGNWFGAAAAVGFFIIVAITLWVRGVMRRGVFERALSYCCVVSSFLAPLAFVQMKFFPPEDERAVLWFFNSNFMAYMCLIAFGISAYKLLNGKGHLWIYAVSLLANIVSMYYCGSIFIWVDCFVVTAMLLVLFKKWPAVAILLGLLAVGAIALYFSPELMPRWYAVNDSSNSRFSIWRAAVQEIKKSPFIGKGFLAFNHINSNYPEAFAAPHTHNMLLELLLDFGILGSALLIPFFVFYFKNLKRCFEYSVNRNTTNLILALVVATAVHGFIDIVFIWIQTGGLLGLMLAGLGMDERLLNRVASKPIKTPKAEPAPEQQA